MESERQERERLCEEAERLNAETDWYLAQRRARVVKDYSGDLIFKTRDDALVQPQPSPRMDEAATAAWNEWFSKGFYNHIEHVLDIRQRGSARADA